MIPPHADARRDDFDRGLANRRRVLGDAWVDQSISQANGFNAEFQELITRYAWHEIWGRPGLDPTTRRLLVLGMTMGLARWEEFELHCKAAIRGGVALGAIKETLMQGAIYCGVPAANTAFKITVGLLRDEGLLPPPAPLTADLRVSRHDTFSQPQLAVAVQGGSPRPAGAGLPAGAARRPVVLSHALGLDHRMWDAFAARLGALGHAVLRYDHRGHGASAVPTGPYAMDDLVDDAARLVGEWGRGPVVWIGLSMGGMVGQGLAIRYPERVSALVLANTTSRYPEAASTSWSQRISAVRAGGMDAVVATVLQRYVTSTFMATNPAVVEVLRQRVSRTDAEGYAACCAAVAGVDWFDRLHEIRCPALVVAGADDVGAPVAMSEAIAGRIEGSRLVVIPDAAHLSVLEQPVAFGAAVEAFVGGLDEAA